MRLSMGRTFYLEDIKMDEEKKDVIEKESLPKNIKSPFGLPISTLAIIGIVATVIIVAIILGITGNNDNNSSDLVDCLSCGDSFDETMNFCPNCGAKKETPNTDNSGNTNNDDGDNNTNVCSHNWKTATCTVPKTCSKCGETSGNALGHTWKAASCTQPKTCSKCGRTDGSALNHSYENGKCKVCGKADPINTAIANMNSRIKIYGTHIYINSADGVSVYIEWENLYNKEIKYIYFKTELYNRVNDLLSCDISDEEAKWLYQTGPIPQGKGMYSSAGGVSSSDGAKRPFRPDVSYSEYKKDKENGWADDYWDCIWYNSQAYYVKIVGVEIEYMDGTTFAETNRNVFEQLDIVSLNINQDSYDYAWVYPTSAKLVAQNIPYSSDNVYIESLSIDSVKGIDADEALFVCQFKGYSYEWGVNLSIKVVDQFGNRVDDNISTYVIITQEGDFTETFSVITPINGTYYLVIEYDY